MYDGVVLKLAKVMADEDNTTKQKGKNWGEILTTSIAKVKEIPIIMSDESNNMAYRLK